MCVVIIKCQKTNLFGQVRTINDINCFTTKLYKDG
jgi:hypothetical protein